VRQNFPQFDKVRSFRMGSGRVPLAFSERKTPPAPARRLRYRESRVRLGQVLPAATKLLGLKTLAIFEADTDFRLPASVLFVCRAIESRDFFTYYGRP
jgi:hypothetical protein